MPLRLAVGVLGILLGLWSHRVSTTATSLSVASRVDWGPAFSLLVGWSLTGAAILVLRDRPRSAALAAALAYVWFIANLADPATTSALGFTAGLLLSASGPALVAHLLLIHPGGRPAGAAARLLIATGYLLTVGVLGVAVTLTYDPAEDGCTACMPNLLLVAALAEQRQLVLQVGLVLLLSWLAVVLVAGSWRIVSAPPSVRPMVAVVGVACLGSLATTDVQAWLRLSDAYGPADQFLIGWLLNGCWLVMIGGALVVDLVLAQRARRELSGLVVGLGSVDTSEDLQSALADRFADPSLTIRYPRENGGGYLDGGGRVVEAPGSDSPTVTRLRRDGRELAAILHRPGLLDHQAKELTETLDVAVQYARLTAEDRAQLEAIAASGRRLVRAGDAERSRLEHDLHDGAQQRLVGLLMMLREVRASGGADPDSLAELEVLIRRALSELRLLAHRLSPPMLRDAGLLDALEALAESRPLRLGSISDSRYSDVVELTAYQLVSRVSQDNPCRVEVADHGSRVQTKIIFSGPPPRLDDLMDRANSLSGRLRVAVDQPAAGDSTACLDLPRV